MVSLVLTTTRAHHDRQTLWINTIHTLNRIPIVFLYGLSDQGSILFYVQKNDFLFI